MVAPAVASVVTAVDATGTSTSVTVPMPSGTVDGDMLVAVITSRSGTAYTPPTGWTLISQITGTTIAVNTFWKLAASETGPYTFTQTVASRQAGGIVRITGASPTAPVDVFSTSTGLSATSLVTASVDPSVTDTLLLEAFGASIGTTTITVPAGSTSQWSFSASAVTAAPTSALGTETLAVDTPTGTRTATATNAANYATQMIAIKAPAVEVASDFAGWGVPI